MIAELDHLVLTTNDVDKCVQFYTEVLGMRLEKFGNGRIALRFNTQKINVHELSTEAQPKAQNPVAGALDLCFLVNQPLDQVITFLKERDIPIVAGPAARTGARFALRSIYLHDPDGNLIELSESL